MAREIRDRSIHQQTLAQAHPNGRVRTQMLNYTGDACVFYAELYADKDDKDPVATGWAEEIKTDRGVNATSFVENCETSAIGRACANFVFATQGKRPSREEMSKVARSDSQVTLSPIGSSKPVHAPSGAFATPPQLAFIRKLAKRANMDDLNLLEFIQRTVNRDDAVLELLKSHEASAVIEALK